MFKNFIYIFIILFTVCTGHANAAIDPLPSWNNGPTKQKIINFVQNVTDKNNKNYTAPEDRIVTIDNDGTLWLEQPMYTQFMFAIARVYALAPKHPEWKKIEPFKSILNHNEKALVNFKGKDIDKLFAATSSSISEEEYMQIVKKWLASAKNKRFNRLYTQLVYQPMLELMDYLRQNNFTLYIVTGGGQDFVRVFAPEKYGIPIEHVIGTAGKTQYRYQQGHPVIIKLPQLLFFCDKAGKPEAINLLIGRHPLIAIGNSIGDQQMLEWTQAKPGPHFMMLIHHDDANREYAYGANSKVGTFTNALMQEALANKWTIVSMKEDWKTIFPQ